MSTPLELAVDIAGAVSRIRAAQAAVDARKLAGELSLRHAETGFSVIDITDALIEEGRAAGLRFDKPAL